MQTWLAKIIYRIVSGEGNHTPQFDEQVRLIQAHNYSEALGKANETGKQHAEVFKNVYHQNVHWQFLHVTGLVCLAGFVDGDEIFSEIKDVPDAENYEALAHDKAQRISGNCCLNLANTKFN